MNAYIILEVQIWQVCMFRNRFQFCASLKQAVRLATPTCRAASSGYIQAGLADLFLMRILRMVGHSVFILFCLFATSTFLQSSPRHQTLQWVSSGMEFPSPVGGVPLPSDFGPSILFSLLYFSLVPIFLVRLFDKRSRAVVSINAIIATIER